MQGKELRSVVHVSGKMNSYNRVLTPSCYVIGISCSGAIPPLPPQAFIA